MVNYFECMRRSRCGCYGCGRLIGCAEVYEGRTVPKKPDPTRDGYTFMGWYTSCCRNEKWDFSKR